MRSLALIGVGIIGSAVGRAANPDVSFPASFLVGVFYAVALGLAYIYLVEKIEGRL